MFTLQWTAEAIRAFHDLESQVKNIQETSQKKSKSSRQEGVFKQVVKTLKFLRENPRHPGLRTHAYSELEHPWSKDEKVFEAYVQNNTPGAYRIFWCYGPKKQEITIISITAHP